MTKNSNQNKKKQHAEIREISYNLAVSRFQNKNFWFATFGDYSEFGIPVSVKVKRFSLPPDAFAVWVDAQSAEMQLFSPSPDGGDNEVLNELTQPHLDWITKFLSSGNRATKFDNNMWFMTEKEHYLLGKIFNSKYKKVRDNVITQSPYSSTDELLEFVNSVFSSFDLFEIT